ncbi:hypothetical protein Tco_0562297 [Tanacetum coccineum]
MANDSCDPMDTPMVEKSQKLDKDNEGKAVRSESHYRVLERVNCVLWISGLYTLRLLGAACKNVLNLLKKGLLQRLSLLGKKVVAIMKSAWTEKDQIDNFLKQRRLMRSLESSLVGDCMKETYGCDKRTI